MGLLLVFGFLLTAWFLRLFTPVSVTTTFTVTEVRSAFRSSQNLLSERDLGEALGRSLVEYRQLEDQLAAIEAEYRSATARCPSPRSQNAEAIPALPATRWREKDLSILHGCWQLGRDAPAVRGEVGVAQRETNCVMKASRICLDNNGQGTFDELVVCPKAGAIKCTAPVAARFESSESIVLTKPQVVCTQGAPTTWLARTYSCRRVDNATALCVGHAGRPGFPDFELEFRRAH
jgi:hypothetical protein